MLAADCMGKDAQNCHFNSWNVISDVDDLMCDAYPSSLMIYEDLVVVCGNEVDLVGLNTGSPKITYSLLSTVDYCGLDCLGSMLVCGLQNDGVNTIDVDSTNIINYTLGGHHMGIKIVQRQHGGVTLCVGTYTQGLLMINDDGRNIQWEVRDTKINIVVAAIPYFRIHSPFQLLQVDLREIVNRIWSPIELVTFGKTLLARCTSKNLILAKIFRSCSDSFSLQMLRLENSDLHSYRFEHFQSNQLDDRAIFAPQMRMMTNLVNQF